MIFNRRNLMRVAGVVACCLAFVVLSAMNNTGGVHKGGAVKDRGAVKLLLAKDGKPAAIIVIGKDAKKAARFAPATERRI